MRISAVLYFSIFLLELYTVYTSLNDQYSEINQFLAARSVEASGISIIIQYIIVLMTPLLLAITVFFTTKAKSKNKLFIFILYSIVLLAPLLSFFAFSNLLSLNGLELTHLRGIPCLVEPCYR